MKTLIFPLIVLILSIPLASCTKEVKYTKEELLKIAQEAEPSVKLILPSALTGGVSCSDYPSGCASAHIVQVKGLDLIAVEFTTQDEAILAAKKLRGYYVRNWLLDDVTGEPLLEKFVTEKLEAKKP
jgi:hypothetical protein